MTISTPRSSPTFVLSRVVLACTFVLAYVFLDWASYLDPFHHLNITAWNPAPALGILFLMKSGPGGFGALVSAMLVSDAWVRNPDIGLLTMIFLNLSLATGYKLLAIVLKHMFGGVGMFSSRDTLQTWVSVVISLTMINSMVFVTANIATGLLPSADWGIAMLRLWLGDAVGILVTFPLLWGLRSTAAIAEFKATVLNTESLGYMMLSLAMLWIAFGIGAESSFRYFYVLFLPVVLAATRQGLAGAVLSVATMQCGMVVGGQLQDANEVSMIEIQMRVAVLALIGFFIGVVVDEQRRVTVKLRESMRLAAAGEMAGAIAHELNQPLTALSSYSSACRLLVEQQSYVRLGDVASKMINEAERASNVVRRLRDLFGSGTTTLERMSLEDMITSVGNSFLSAGSEDGITLELVNPIPDVELYVDRIQIEMLFRNLLSNAKDSLKDSDTPVPAIIIHARRDAVGSVQIRVEDNGPGVSPGIAMDIFEPFISTKSSGLGLGLAICKEIMAAHGGKLRYLPADHGCFELEFPIEP